ncbi:MAG: exonuclease domain-containing protein [Deltaproteobacteria bacterium]
MEKHPLSMAVEEVAFAFLDVETTGLDPYSGDRICEIAMLKTRGAKVIDTFETLVNPGRAMPPRAVSVNGITDAMIRSSPFFRDVAKDVQNFLSDTVIVAHNASFDLGFVSAEFANLRIPPPANEIIDTLGIARRYYNFPSNGLGKIARHLGIPIASEHRALSDAGLTKDIFDYFILDLRRRGMRISRLKDALKLHGKYVDLEKSNALVIPPDIEHALRLRRKVQIKYLSAYAEDTTTRVIEPQELKLSGSYTYVVAFCHLRKERCSFRLDRILEVKCVS